MSNLPRILCASIATFSTIAVLTPAARADLIDNFQVAGPFALAGQHAPGAGPSFVTEEGNRFLRILSGVNDQHNSYTYELVAGDEGAFEKTVAAFDFRVSGAVGADGIGFILVPTSLYGVSGTSTRPGVAEEPNLAGAFGLAIDMYPSLNNISTHFNGAQMTEINTVNQGFVDLDFRANPVFNRVQIELDRVGNGTHAVVTITPDSLNATPGTPVKIFESLMPNMLPYEYRVQFLGRTGGLNMIADIDNVNVASSGAAFDPASLPAAPIEAAGHLYQDFDSTGTTFYRAIQVGNSDSTTFRPGPMIKTTEENNTSDGNFLRLVNDNVNSQNNRIIFDRARDGGPSNATEILEFDMRFNAVGAPADGLGLLFAPTIDPGNGADITNGNGFDIAEEANLAGSLGIGFDVYKNEDPDTAPAVSLHYNGVSILEQPLPAELGLGSFHHVQVRRETVAGGLNVSVIATPNINGVAGAPITLIDNHFVEGARNYDHRVQFTGRTGGAFADHDLDNITSSQVARGPSAFTQARFGSALEAPYKGYALGAGAGPQIRNDMLDDPNGDYLRLVHDNSNSQGNSLAFDKQLDGSINGATSVKGEFTFRVSSADRPADGFAMMLIPTLDYNTSGAGAAATPNFVAEEPNAPGVFALGFDLYDPNIVEFNEISAHWNGAVQTAQVLTNFDLHTVDSLAFHKVRFELRATGDGTLLDMSIIPNAYFSPGPEIVVFDAFPIFGMNLFDYRVEFAARTGGSNMSVDLDDILVQTVPEPTSAALLAIGGVAMGCFRRSRRRSA